MRTLGVPEFVSQVREAVYQSRPEDRGSAEFRRWFSDVGRIARAASYASEGRESAARSIAEELAERYYVAAPQAACPEPPRQPR